MKAKQKRMRNSGKNIKISVNNIIAGYTDEGPENAPVIIFIHGFPFSKEMWNKQMEALRENFRMKAIDDILENGIEKFADDSVKIFFAPDSFSTKKELVAEVREIMINTSEKSVIKTLLALSKRKETCSKLSEIKVPVLILVGDKDKITPPEAAQFMHEEINGSVMSIIKNAGHLSNLENLGQFNELLKRFLENK